MDQHAHHLLLDLRLVDVAAFAGIGLLFWAVSRTATARAALWRSAGTVTARWPPLVPGQPGAVWLMSTLRSGNTGSRGWDRGGERDRAGRPVAADPFGPRAL